MAGESTEQRMKRVLRLELPLVVHLGRTTLSLRSLATMVPGYIIDLPREADSALDLFVNNCQIGEGTAVKVGENFGIQVTLIGTARERAEAVAAGPAAQEEDNSAMDPTDPAALAAALLAGQ